MKKYILFLIAPGLFICEGVSSEAKKTLVIPSPVMISKSQIALFEKLTKETQEHIRYHTEMGLGERAKGIKISWYHFEESHLNDVDLSSFTRRTPIPQEVLSFDPQAKNTLITTDSHVSSNKPEDLQKILDIRLYPALRNLIKKNRVEVFLGTKQEMAAYYKSKGLRLLFEFTIPSSATYYLAESAQGEPVVIMAGLVSRENIIAQLLTLKLAGLKTDAINIIGDVDHFRVLVKKDIDDLLQQLPELKIGSHPLIVAGCGREGPVSEIIQSEFPGQLGAVKSFKGNVVSLSYIPLLNPINGIHGFISLNLCYGDIMEMITDSLLNKANCKHVFTGGAGGYIPAHVKDPKPEIGSRILITQAMNEQGETVKLNESETLSTYDQDVSPMHLQIPSIFLETYTWLNKARQRGSSVDVETFYIIRAIKNYNAKNLPAQVKADCGYFVSDYVGEQPLREYSKVYQKYPEVLSGFLQETLAKN